MSVERALVLYMFKCMEYFNKFVSELKVFNDFNIVENVKFKVENVWFWLIVGL